MIVQTGPSRVRVEGSSTTTSVTDLSVRGADDKEVGPGTPEVIKMGNPWYICVLGVVIWLLIVILNVANLVLLGRG
ncbi:hypothetical protein O1611_g9119 [Lasiodiplodia mahajangana]|uniref:Uncharacterized protein n=1 Tax=Lasiodiplodia mahajangana TaxID=1108764 RepID=A0ACC2JAK7_9PEZI|nr:hypothetical protein O1611_g9119 [Lasiodiplodia mahajangana]